MMIFMGCDLPPFIAVQHRPIRGGEQAALGNWRGSWF